MLLKNFTILIEQNSVEKNLAGCTHLLFYPHSMLVVLWRLIFYCEGKIGIYHY